jgi:hypothetical protein
MEAKMLLIEEEGPASAITPVASPVVQITSVVEAKLPLRLSAKWVACACRMAGVAKPRWNRHTSVWTTTATRDDGSTESIAITQGPTPQNVVIEVAWLAPQSAMPATATGRRLVTSFFTGMQWSMRHKKLEPV